MSNIGKSLRKEDRRIQFNLISIKFNEISKLNDHQLFKLAFEGTKFIKSATRDECIKSIIMDMVEKMI